MQIKQGSVHPEVITLINEARQFLILVSPYLKPWQGLTMAIERARARGVAIVLILRGGDGEQEERIAAAAPLRPFLQGLLFIERLHAKIYLSDQAAVLTSMNLHESSALNTIEFAASMTRAGDPDSYQQTYKMCESLIALGEQDRQRGAWGRSTGSVASVRESAPAPRKREASRRTAGHCIRCGDDIALNPEKPLCADCYKIWSKYEDEDYEEERCHGCGRKSATSLRKPLCRSCYEAAA